MGISYKHNLNIPSSILSNDINSILVDNNNGIWLATSKGLSFFQPSLQKNKYFYFYNNPIIPSSILINHVEKINADEFLIGTDFDGLFYHNSESKFSKKIAFPNGINQISAMLKLNYYSYLIGTNKGIFTFDLRNKTCSKFTFKEFNFDLTILNLKQLAKNKIAICTNKGIFVFDNFSNEILYSGLNSGGKSFCKDAFLFGEDLWILFFFDGIELYNLKTKKLKDLTPISFKGKPINYCNFSNDDKSIFVSTSSGLIVQNLKNKEKYKILKTKNGLIGDNIENVCFTKNHELFYTTSTGLFQYNFIKSKSKSVTSYENYVQKWYNQLTETNEGNLIFSISDYFMIKNPSLNVKNNKTPSLEIQEFTVNDKSWILENNEMIFSHFENNLKFHFSALVYPESEKNVWFYKLNNLPVNEVKNGQIELSNLPPDTYKLFIFSTNNEGRKSIDSKIIYFQISHPFYYRWWFYCLILSVIILVFYLFYRFKKKELLKMAKIRNQISRDLHDELGANVSSINIMSKMLMQKNKMDDNVALQNISKYSIQISDTINDIIWNVNPKFDSIDELIKKMVRFASESLEATEIDYSIDIPKYSKEIIVLENEIKYHIYLIFKEGLNNALKYAKAEKIVIKINLTDNIFTFLIQDNGIGFDISQTEKGNGLNNMKSRAKEINAKIDFKSMINVGSEISFSIKI